MNVGDYVYVKHEVEQGRCTPYKIKKFIKGTVLLEGREMETCFKFNGLLSVDEGRKILKDYFSNQVKEYQNALDDLEVATKKYKRKIENKRYVCIARDLIQNRLIAYEVVDATDTSVYIETAEGIIQVSNSHAYTLSDAISQLRTKLFMANRTVSVLKPLMKNLESLDTEDIIKLYRYRREE